MTGRSIVKKKKKPVITAEMFHIFKSRQMNYKSGQTRCFSLAVQSVESKLFHFPNFIYNFLHTEKTLKEQKQYLLLFPIWKNYQLKNTVVDEEETTVSRWIAQSACI